MNTTTTEWILAQRVRGPIGGRFVVAERPHPCGGYQTSRIPSEWKRFHSEKEAQTWIRENGDKTLSPMPIESGSDWLFQS